MKYLNTLEDPSADYQDFSPLKDWTNRNSRRKTIKKRKRKSVDQLRTLSQEFKNGTEWDKEMMSRLSKKTGLSEAQIYKWSWDQKKKLQIHDKLKTNKNIYLSEIFDKLPEIPVFVCSKENNFCIGTNCFECTEIIPPQHIDYQLYDIQKNYRYGVENLIQMKVLSNGGLDNFLEEFSRV